MSEKDIEIYRFKYSVFTVDARFVDGLLVAKTGIRTSVTPIEKLQYLYVDSSHHREDAELILAFAGRKGRLKRVRIFADQGEPEFERLIKALLQRRPDTDIRHLSLTDAYTHMGSKQMEKVVIPTLLSLALAAAALLFMPLILHGLDTGEIRTTPSELVAMEHLKSRNIILEDSRLLVDKAVTEISESESRMGLTSAWIPLVRQTWQPGQTVDIILLVRHVQPEVVSELSQAKDYDGILRNIWWEGLDGQRRQDLVARDLVISPEPLLLEWGKRGADDGVIALVLLSILCLILLALGVGLLRNAKHLEEARKQADRPSPWPRR